MEEDFSDKSVWKKQFSQDGNEYFVNLRTGQVKQPPRKQTTRNTAATADMLELQTPVEENIAPKYNGVTYIQQYTTDKVPFFVDMHSGVSTWTLPEGTPESAVKFITHLTDQGIPYYEDTATKTTSWTLPLEKLSTAARRSSMALRKMNRRQSNVFMTSANTETAAALAALRDLDQDGTDKGGGSPTLAQNRAPFSTSSHGSDGGRRSGEDDEGDALFRPRSRGRGAAAASSKNAAAPKRLSRMAGAAKTQPSTGGGSAGPAGGKKMEDMRAVRANKRAQNLKGSPATGNESSDDDADPSESHKPFASSPSPTPRGKAADSPTMSDVSSVTATSAGLMAGTKHGDKSDSHSNAFGMFGDSACTRPLVRIIFEKYDKGGKGCLDVMELQELCYDFGTYLSTDDLRLAMRDLDTDGDGTLSYEEFMVWWRTNDRFSSIRANDSNSKLRQEAAAVFKKYDTDLSGDISRQEFAKLHRELQREKLVKLNLDNCILQLDENGDGIIQFNEFITWIEKGPLEGSGAPESKQQQAKRRNSLSKFFGSLLGGGGDAQQEDSVAHIVTSSQPKLVKAKDHADYAKFFRMAEVGGNIVDIRRQMSEFDLDDSLIQTPEKMIPAESKLNVRNHLHQATAGTYLERVGEFDFHDDESDGMSSKASSVAQLTSQHVSDKDFTDMFRRKPNAQTQESNQHVNDKNFTDMFRRKPALTEGTTENQKKPKVKRRKANTVVHILKPLGITMGENVEDEEQGVHVASCAPNGNAAATGLVHPGMILLEACDENVRYKDFDDIMDILRGAPPDEKLKLVFSPAEGDEWEEVESEPEEVSEPKSPTTPATAPEATSPTRPAVSAAAISEALLRSDSDESEAEETDDEQEKTAPPTTLVDSKPIAAPNTASANTLQSNPRAPVTQVTTTSTVGSTSPPAVRKSAMARKGAAAIAAKTAAKSPAATNRRTEHLAAAVHRDDEEATQKPPQPPPPPTRTRSTPDQPAQLSTATSPATSATSDANNDDSSGDNWGRISFQEAPQGFGEAGAVSTTGGVFGLPDHLDAGQYRSSKIENKSMDNPIRRSRTTSPPRHLHGVHNHGDADPEWTHEDKVDAITSPLQNPGTSSEGHGHLEDSPVLENAAITSRPRGPRTVLLRGKGSTTDGEKRAVRGGIARVTPPQQKSTARSSPRDIVRKSAGVAQTPADSAGVFGIGTGYFDESDDEDIPPPSTVIAATAPEAATAPSKAATTHSTKQVSNSLPKRTGGSSLGDQLKALRSMKRAGSSAGSATSNASSLPVSVHALSSSRNSDDDDRAADATSTKSGASLFSDRSRRSRFSAASGRGAAVTQHGERSVASPLSSSEAMGNSMPEGVNITPQEDGAGRVGGSSGASSPSSTLRSKYSFNGSATTTSPEVKQSGGFSPKVTHKPLTAFDKTASLSAPRLGSRAALPLEPAPVGVPPVQVEDRGMQSDYSSYVDEKYINSYQMLLGERQEIEQMREALEKETEERAAMLLVEEEESIRRIAQYEEESLCRLRAEEDVLRDRVREVEDIILMERNDIDQQWEELRAAEADSDRTVRLRMKELMEIMHVVRAHHDQLQHDKKRIARQRLHLDMALHDLNRFNTFGGGAGPHNESSGGGSAKMQHRRPNTPTSGRRWISPHPGSSRGWAGTDGGLSVTSGNSSRRMGSPAKERPFRFSTSSSRNGR